MAVETLSIYVPLNVRHSGDSMPVNVRQHSSEEHFSPLPPPCPPESELAPDVWSQLRGV